MANKWIETNHPLVLEFFQNLQREMVLNHKTDSGTYNKADPTHFEKGLVDFSYKGKDYELEWFDCTWGIEYTLYRKITKFRHTEIGGFYYSRDYKDNKIIYRRRNKGLLKLLYLNFKEVMNPFHFQIIEEEECWIDPAGGIHYPGEWDPAKMYE